MRNPGSENESTLTNRKKNGFGEMDHDTLKEKNIPNGKSFLIGDAMVSATKIINENIIVFRYTSFSLITLLGAYGLSKTPLFARFKSIHDIPRSYYVQRKTINCRIVHVLDRPSSTLSQKEAPITFLVRHLSPVERLMNQTVFNYMTNNDIDILDHRNDLLRVELGKGLICSFR